MGQILRCCVLQVCQRLPAVEVSWRGPRLNESAQDESAQAEASTSEEGAASASVLHIHLRRLRGAHGRALPRVYAPRFPKVSRV